MSSSTLHNMLENIAPIDIGTDDFSFDDEYESGWNASTPHKSNRRDEARSPLTPTLSLPDSFDGEYGPNTGNKQQIPYNRDVEMKKMRAEVARIRELLQDRQGMFRDLKISDALYQHLRLRPENDLTTHELACLRSHEFSLAPKKELETTRRTLQDTNDALQVAQKKAAELEIQNVRLTRQQTLTDETQRMEIASLEERLTRQSQRLKEELAARQVNEEKAASFDRVQIELSRALKELSTLQATTSTQQQQLLILTQSEKDARAGERDSERARELLVLDKSFLTQQLTNTESQRDANARAYEAAVSKALGLELKVTQLSDQLLNQQLAGRSGFDERMDRELTRLREDSQRELDQLRQSHKELMERENAVLKNSKEYAEGVAETLRKQVSIMSTEAVSLQQQLSAIQGQRATDISELRAELKMKTFELTSLGTVHSEKMSIYRQCELELETVKGELAAHKAAFARLEGEKELSMASIKTQLQLCQSRLQAYEALEEEIDQSVLRVAQAGLVAGDITNPSAEFLLSMKSVPSHPERRAKQAVLLAQRLLDMEKQRDAALVDVAAKVKENKILLRQIEIAKESLARTSQPAVYLVTKLRDEELAHADALSRISQLRLELEGCERTKTVLLAESAQLRERLSSMLTQRGELETLREMLGTLASAECDTEGEMGTEADTYGALGVIVDGETPRASVELAATASTGTGQSDSPHANSPTSRGLGLGAQRGLSVDTSMPSSPRLGSPRSSKAGPGSPAPSPKVSAGANAGSSGSINASPGTLERMMRSPSAVNSSMTQRRSPGSRPQGWHQREEL